MKVQLLRTDELPRGWRYPRGFLRLVDRGLTFIEPWYVLAGSQLRADLERLRTVQLGGSILGLVPFARREDRDEVACWAAGAHGGGYGVVVLRSQVRSEGAVGDVSREWQVETLSDFRTWLALAIGDMVAYDGTLPQV